MLPAAAHTNVPLPTALSTASISGEFLSATRVPKDRLITSAPFEIAQSIPCISNSVVPKPL